MTDQALDQLARQLMLDAARLEYGGILEERPEHDFSPAFERGMKKLLRRGRHPVLYRVLRAAACLLLALLLSGCTVLAVSPAAREVFFGWVRAFHTPAGFKPYISYTYSGDKEDFGLPEGVAYRPTWISEGWKIFDENSSLGGSYIMFENGTGGKLSFCSVAGLTTSGLQMTMTEGDTMKKAEVHGRPADLYLGAPGSKAASFGAARTERGSF